ncbi:hypothetical protein [Streptomyces soliscabiei]|uniref:hypothetical protein n=1 Tax=Streptomyces soliscabiei TaxID=588897 RepID=UPI0029A81798|nr:hypothetical protein [Streptomyces sp. NY05-11A]MDX2682909.1 hypothetical protein [Streptomyces sp. NY05-11A]
MVDDEPERTELLSAAATEAGGRSFSAQDGRGPLRIARDCAPHGVVLDGMRPDVDDLVLAESTREVQRGAPASGVRRRNGHRPPRGVATS